MVFTGYIHILHALVGIPGVPSDLTEGFRLIPKHLEGVGRQGLDSILVLYVCVPTVFVRHVWGGGTDNVTGLILFHCRELPKFLGGIRT